MRRALLVLKRSAFDLYVNRHQEACISALHQDLGNLEDRHKVHEATIEHCKDILDCKGIRWKLLHRDELIEPIKDVDLAITVGGDGTLLQASHYLDSSIPLLGINSDPTQIDEVDEKMEEFDATRSVGYLCAATKGTFEQVLHEVLEGRRLPVYLHRILACLNGSPLKVYALNDVLLAHPNPAAVTRCTFSIHEKQSLARLSPLIHSRSSGLRICTGVGSTAAMQSAGGHPMASSSAELQYMVREPISPHPSHKEFSHGFIKEHEFLRLKFGGRQGTINFDGSHLCYSVRFGDVMEFSADAPPLQAFLNTSCPVANI